MNNLVIRYYYVIWFLHFISRDERPEVLDLFKNNDFLLKCSNGRMLKITQKMVKIMGFDFTSALFKPAIILKRKLTK